jgi:hypothetical protein
MKYSFIFFLLLLSISALSGQSPNENLNGQLEEMKKLFLTEDFRGFSNFTYSKVLDMMGGKEKMIQATTSSMNQMKKEGFQILDLNFKNASAIISHDKELQCSLTQELLMQIPQGKLLATYTLIAISSDEGKNWKFMDTSGKSKETMLKYFPNLSPDIVIKQKTQKMIE